MINIECLVLCMLFGMLHVTLIIYNPIWHIENIKLMIFNKFQLWA